MHDFFSAMPPDLLLRYVHERQAEIRDEAARVRLATPRVPAGRPRPNGRFVQRLRSAAPLVAGLVLAQSGLAKRRESLHR